MWIQAFFTFSTAVGTASGILRLVPVPCDRWKAHTIFTSLEGLHGCPELTGPLREQEPKHGTWPEQRKRESECEGTDQQPAVLIVGGGQSGLELAARLKYLGVKTLVIEREARIGHLWRKRYEALCLHDTVCMSDKFSLLLGLFLTERARVRPYAISTVSTNSLLLFRPARSMISGLRCSFPPTWPVFAPAPKVNAAASPLICADISCELKVADWLESYAHSLELDVWTSSKVSRASQDPETKKWTVEIERENLHSRTLVVNHLVFALGFGGGTHNMPQYPGAVCITG